MFKRDELLKLFHIGVCDRYTWLPKNAWLTNFNAHFVFLIIFLSLTRNKINTGSWNALALGVSVKNGSVCGTDEKILGVIPKTFNKIDGQKT